MAETVWHCGQLVEIDGLLAVVVFTDAEPSIPEGHVALWFGSPQAIRKSEGGMGGLKPEVSIVPAELCNLAADMELRH